MKTPMLEGRDFRDGDAKEINPSGKEPGVAIVNRRFAQHFFPGRSAVGKHIGWGEGPAAKLSIEIVGVAADSLYEGPREGVHRQVFVPNWGKSSGVFYVRTLTPSAASYSIVRNEVRQLDATIPVFSMKTVEGQLDETLLTDRLIAMLSAGFGLVATLLATVGLYGVMAFVVARRRKELGIRLALGAQPGWVVWLVMREVRCSRSGWPPAFPPRWGSVVTSRRGWRMASGMRPAIAGATVVLLTAVSAWQVSSRQRASQEGDVGELFFGFT
jgi:hypothetical protein